MRVRARGTILPVLVAALLSCGTARADSEATRGDPRLWRTVAVPEPFRVTRAGRTFGGDLRIGDLTGNGRCDLLVYRCADAPAKGAHAGGIKPVFLGAFDLDGRPLWHAGKGGNQPSRPMSVAVHDVAGDAAAEVVCFWHRPAPESGEAAGWDTLADVLVQIRDGRTGRVLRQAAPAAVRERRRRDPSGANWVHQRLLLADLRGTGRAQDIVAKLGDTVVALDDRLRALWTYRSRWYRYSRCPAYIPAVGDADADGRDEVLGGYFLLDSGGTPLWEKQLGRNMDSVAIAEWDHGKKRAVCSGFGHVVDHQGRVILRLGPDAVPHGQEVRVADFRGDLPGPEMVLRAHGHSPEVLVVGSAAGKVVDRLRLNPSPNNTGMTVVYWNGPDKPARLFNGGWLWNVETGRGAPLPGLPPPGGTDVHRMGFYHAIAADVCGDGREDLVVWDPTAAVVYVYTPEPLDTSAYGRYTAGPRQYNPRLMD